VVLLQFEGLSRPRIAGVGCNSSLHGKTRLWHARAGRKRVSQFGGSSGKIALRDAQGQFLNVTRASSPGQLNIEKIPPAGSVPPPAGTGKPAAPNFIDNVGFISPLTEAQRKTIAERIVKEGGGIVTDRNISNADRAAIAELVKQLSTNK